MWYLQRSPHKSTWYSQIDLGFQEHQFVWCFLHILNLACQAAISVYDPDKKIKRSKKVRLVRDQEFDDFSGSDDSADPEDPDFNFDGYSDDESDGDFEVYEEELRDVPTKSNVIQKVFYF